MRRIDSIVIRGNQRNYSRDAQGDGAWEQAVFELLERVFCTHVGAAIRAYLRRERRLYITPERRRRRDGQVTSWPGTLPVGVYRDAYVRGERVRWPSDDPGTPIRHEEGMISREGWGGMGTGRGTHSRIRIDVDRIPRQGLPWPADEVLVHEMIHAMRQQSGVLDNGPAGFEFGTFDEFAAITITNMYRSELRRTHRAHHGDVPARRDYLAWPTAWGTHPRIEFERDGVARLRRQMPGFTTRLALLPPKVCPHNPFVEYWYNVTSTLLPTPIPPQPPMSTGWHPARCVAPHGAAGDDDLDDDDLDDRDLDDHAEPGPDV